MASEAIKLSLPAPQDKQIEFMKADNLYVAYGGARGGGKSWALRSKLIIMCCAHAGINCLLIRRTYKELWENHIQYIIQDLYPLLTAKGPARVRHDKEHSVFEFPNGSRLKYGYCDGKEDLLQFQGQQYDIIGIDEATQMMEEVFTVLGACIRGNPELPKRFYITCNPGGIGHQWVKRLFVDRIFTEDEYPDDYCMIRAKATDNEFNGPQYTKMLNSLPEEIRKAWRDGDWDVYIGQFFPEWKQERIEVEQIRNIPDHYEISMVMDYGLDCFAPLWIVTNEVGVDTIIRGDEYKNCIVAEAAEAIKKTEEKYLKLKGRMVRRYAPPDLWNRSSQTGESIIDMFNKKGYYFLKADNDREAGWLAIKERLNTDSLKVVKGAATQLCKYMPMLQHSEANPNDTENRPHDITHSPDSLRYFCIMRQRSIKPDKEVVREDYFAKDILPTRRKTQNRINASVFKRWK